MMPVPRNGGAQHDLAGAVTADDVVVQRAGLAQRHADQLALGLLGRLADRLGNFARLAVAEADAALLVADDDERGKAEAPAALDHLGHAVDVDQAVDELAVALFTPAAILSVSHRLFLCRGSELQPAFAGRVGQGLDPAVIHVGAAVEHDLADTWPPCRARRSACRSSAPPRRSRRS